MVPQRIRILRQAFNLTPLEWEQILAHQGGVCYICERPFTPPRKAHTDHDHRTGHVRGILCSQCNRALGKAEDPRWQWFARHFSRAGAYLSLFPATVALGHVVQGFPGKIGTLRYRKWLANKEGRKLKGRSHRDSN
jgi:hypothetical protein